MKRALLVILSSISLIAPFSPQPAAGEFFGQTPATQIKNAKGDDAEIKMNVNLVLMNAEVFEQKTGRIVGDLKKDDFAVFEDGIKQDITHFSKERLPLSIILLVDRGSCLDPFSEDVRYAVRKALNGLKPKDEVALIAFSEEVELLKGFRYDKQMISEALDDMPDHNEESPHCFNRAFYEAAKYMREANNQKGRRAIIVITAITKSFDCSGPSSDEVLRELQESDIIVSTLIPSSKLQRLEDGLMRGITGPGGMFKSVTNLRQIAEETGGDIVSAKPKDLHLAFEGLTDRLSSRYSLGFVSSNAKNDGSYRKLKLEVSNSNGKRKDRLAVKSRRGYVAPKTPKE